MIILVRYLVAYIIIRLSPTDSANITAVAEQTIPNMEDSKKSEHCPWLFFA